MIGRQFRNVSRDDTPCAVYCELQQERSRSQQSGCGRERPQWDDQHRQCESEPNRPAPADVVRDKSGQNAADERSKIGNDGHDCRALYREAALRFQKRRIHVLRAVSAKTHEREKQYEIEKQFPMARCDSPCHIAHEDD